MTQETYKLKFKCWNCGHSWEETITKGHSVEEVFFGFAGTREIIDEWEGKWRDIICQNCGCKEDVRKKLRE